LRACARVEETRRVLGDLEEEFQKWLRRRNRLDTQKRHRSQLRAIGSVVEACLSKIDGTLDGFVDLPVREAYEGCRVAEHQLAFVRRLWGYFHEKWDQRDSEELASVLAAADEVIWSCFQPPLRKLGRESQPAPLAYVTADFSPHAMGPKGYPIGLRGSDELLRETVSRLPVPLIGIPFTCVASPWWLVLVAHEVGHQVAYLIDEIDGGPTVADFLTQATATADLEVRQKWRMWSHEVFADAFASMMVGSAHLWALFELEQGSDEAMVRERASYPPPLVRQAVVASLLAQIGASASGQLPAPPAGLELKDLSIRDNEAERVARLMSMVPKVASALADEEVTEQLSLRKLSGWDEAPLGPTQVKAWANQLREKSPKPVEELEAARIGAVGGLAVWAEIAEEADADLRRERAGALRKAMLDVLPLSREEGYRADRKPAPVDLKELARSVAGDVVRLQPEASPDAAVVVG
jgi:hypothetical protein